MGEEELTLLSQMRPGLVQLEIGVQSTNPDTLREINRSADMGKLRKTVERIRQGRNIHIKSGKNMFREVLCFTHRMRKRQLFHRKES